MIPYPEEVERTMKQFYDSLSEKDRRRYAGVEALRYGHGGRTYISRVLNCSRRTVSKGAKEISGLPQKEVENRIRRPGGGRESYAEQWPEIDAQFLSVLHNHTAGDPMDGKVRRRNVHTLFGGRQPSKGSLKHLIFKIRQLFVPLKEFCSVMDLLSQNSGMFYSHLSENILNLNLSSRISYMSWTWLAQDISKGTAQSITIRY